VNTAKYDNVIVVQAMVVRYNVLRKKIDLQFFGAHLAYLVGSQEMSPNEKREQLMPGWHQLQHPHSWVVHPAS
jgi:hypothetical protein